MSKLARAMQRGGPTGPVTTTSERTTTAEGGAGWVRDAKSELFLLAVTNMVSEKTFYEDGADRDDRFVRLVHQATAEDPGWVARLIPWLRTTANMRTASIIAAAEYSRALKTLDAGRRAEAPTVRSVIDGALQRPDEPGEFCAYWIGTKPTRNTTLPGGVQRGVADAAARLFTERAALKYDGSDQPWRLTDVVALAKPTPAGQWQADLFDYLADRRWKRDEIRVTERLPMIRARRALDAMPQDQRRALLTDGAVERLREAGMTWEALSGWLGGPMDATAWEAIIPSMGLMALVRNLRNFDQAGVRDTFADYVGNLLNDPEQVRKSRMFPLRFLSAYKTAPSLRWAWPLEQAVQHSLSNVPALPGRTLVLVDQSGSMNSGLSDRSTVTRAEAAALFGFALGLRAESADVYVYGADGTWARMTPKHRRVDLPLGASVLPLVKQHGRADMGGTLTWTTLRDTYQGHSRIVVITDEQAHDQPGRLPDVPIVTFNVAGYRAAHTSSGPNRVTVGGLTDAGFAMLGALDVRHRGEWPF